MADLERLTEDEAQFHRKVFQTFRLTEDKFQQHREALQKVEQDYMEARGAYRKWLEHLTEKYQLGNSDRITETGEIIRA